MIMDNLDHEIKRLEAFSATRPYDPHIINRIGYLYYQKGDTKKAVECCKNSIMLFLKNGENEQAITLFEQAAYNDFFDFRTTEELLDSLHSKGLRKDVIHLSLKLAEKNLSTRRQVSHKLFEKVIDIDPKNRVARKYFEHSKEEGQIQTEQKRLKALDEELSSLKEEKTQIKEELSTRIEGLHQEISGYNAEVDRLHQTIQDKTKERDQIAQRADTAEARLKESVNKVAEIEKRLTEDIEALRGEIIQKDTELYKTQEMHIAAEKQLQTLHVDVSSLRDEKARVEAEFRGRIEGLQKEVAEFHAKVNDLTLTTREKERIEEDIERRLKESVKESVALRSNIDELTFVVQEKTKEQEIIAHRLDDTEKSLGKTRDRLAKAERNHEKTEQRMKNEITYLQEVLIQKEDLLSQTQELSAAEKNELLQKITAMKDMSDELQVPHFLDMVAVKEAEIIEVQESLTETIERMNSLEDEISSLETAYQEAEDDRQQKDELIEAVRAELSSIQVEKTHNEGELRGTIGGLEEQVSALRSEIDELTVTLQAKEREREQIARQAGEAEETERQLTEEAALLRAELERKEELLVQSRRAHTEQRDELEQKIASMDKAEAALSELIKAKETELAEARNSLDQASERAGFLEAELSSLETAYQEAEDDRKQQQEELEAVRAELVSLQDEKISVEGKLQGKLEGLETTSRILFRRKSG
jgi:exonuclease SbcC